MQPRGTRSMPRLRARPGFTLVYRGAEIGVVERVEQNALDGTERVHVRGGIAGGLEYLIPEAAITGIDAEGRRAEVDHSVTFVSEPPASNGAIRVSARLGTPRLGTGEPELAPRIGVRVMADDGPLGFVEALSYTDGVLQAIVVRGRHRLRARRIEIPATRLRPSQSRGKLVVAGTRRELHTR
jgi:hypothetical protein